MMDDFLRQLRDDHKDFDLGSLEEFLGHEPFDFFRKCYEEAFETEQPEPNACILSTVDNDNKPSSRVIYLKELVDNQFIFYTNYLSHKGKDIARNPNVSLLFFWPGLQRQIRIEGSCEKVSEAVSEAYFQSRPRSSQIGAWASHQSEELDKRSTLEERFEQYAAKFPEKIPRPPHWGGYALTPQLIEFWQGRPSRLHDRFVFEWVHEEWRSYRKNP